MESVYVDNGLEADSTKSVLSFFIERDKEGELYYNPLYQRDYVWTETEAQWLLTLVFQNKPIGALAIVFNEHAEPSKFTEVVDGRQRLTSLIDFYNGVFPYITPDGKAVYFDDLSLEDQRAFKKTKLPYYDLRSNCGRPVTDIEKVRYFYDVNFGGVPQSQEHKERLENILACEEAHD